MSKKENRKIAFNDYLRKYGLEKYSFFIYRGSSYSDVWLVPTNDLVLNPMSYNFDMITSVDTLINRTRNTMNNQVTIRVQSDQKSMFDKYNSLEEFRRFAVIKRLAGIEK